MNKIGRIINKAEEYVLILLMTLLSVIIFLQVLFRVIGASLPWSEEVSRYITVWISVLGASYGFRYGAHIGVEAFMHWLPFSFRRVIDFLSYMAVAFLSCLMMYYGYSLIVNVHLRFGQVSPAMRMPIWIAYLAIPVGYFMMILRNLQLAIHTVKELLRGEEIPFYDDKREGGNPV